MPMLAANVGDIVAILARVTGLGLARARIISVVFIVASYDRS
jgi:hypothetical protein